jgi:elongation factor G
VVALAGDHEVSIEVDSSGEPLARVFKTVVDPFVGRISLIQVCSGTLRPDAVLFNTRTLTDERLHVLQRLQGKTTSSLNEVVAGDIVAIPKLNGTRIGDTLAPRQTPVALAPIEVSPPLLSIAIRPRTAGDDERLMTALHRLQEEDLALGVGRDDETHQTVLSGLGDAHLQVALERLARKYNVEVEREELRIPYRETICRPAQAEGRYKKQTGGHGQFGVAHLRVEPLERGSGFEFVDEIVGGAIPRQFIPAVEKGVRRVMRDGGAYGFPVVDVRVVLDDGKFHSVDSSEASFEQAGALAFVEALAAADPIPLEPVSRLEVSVPARYLGDVLADVNARRARVGGSSSNEDGEQIIVATVPTSELARYAADLRALTAGRGHFTLVHDHYESVPGHLLDRFPRPRALVS